MNMLRKWCTQRSGEKKKNYLVSNAPVEAISVDEVLVVLWVEEEGELLALPQPLQVVQHNSSVKPLKANLDS